MLFPNLHFIIKGSNITLAKDYLDIIFVGCSIPGSEHQSYVWSSGRALTATSDVDFSSQDATFHKNGRSYDEKN